MANIAEMPEGYGGEGFFATSLSKAVGIARANSIWPLPFATSCCGIEFMATMGTNYDLARFGMERLSFSPRQADLLMVMGTIAKKNGPYPPSGVHSNGGTQMGDCCRRLRKFGWHFRHLFRLAGHRQSDSSRRVCAGLPATPGANHRWRHENPGTGEKRAAAPSLLA